MKFETKALSRNGFGQGESPSSNGRSSGASPSEAEAGSRQIRPSVTGFFSVAPSTTIPRAAKGGAYGAFQNDRRLED
jgi:hypothetical protein